MDRLCCRWRRELQNELCMFMKGIRFFHRKPYALFRFLKKIVSLITERQEGEDVT